MVDFDNIIKNLATYSSKDAEIIANFMYKNTFDNAFKALEKNNIPVRDVVIIMSLYNEKLIYTLSVNYQK
ncbi:hypothetical protein CWS02_00650 [Enterobacter sp. EA-1]|nr:hypothetical protein CWS02_00650 [Enterobacter sp. EA-1]